MARHCRHDFAGSTAFRIADRLTPNCRAMVFGLTPAFSAALIAFSLACVTGSRPGVLKALAVVTVWRCSCESSGWPMRRHQGFGQSRCHLPSSVLPMLHVCANLILNRGPLIGAAVMFDAILQSLPIALGIVLATLPGLAIPLILMTRREIAVLLAFMAGYAGGFLVVGGVVISLADLITPMTQVRPAGSSGCAFFWG